MCHTKRTIPQSFFDVIELIAQTNGFKGGTLVHDWEANHFVVAGYTVREGPGYALLKAFLFRRTSLIKFGDLFLLRARPLMWTANIHMHTHILIYLHSDDVTLFLFSSIGYKPLKQQHPLNKVKKLHLFSIPVSDPFSNKTEYARKERTLRFFFLLLAILSYRRRARMFSLPQLQKI